MSSNGGNNIELRLDERQGGLIAVVTINNPSRLNSMNSALMDEFIEALSSLAANADLRALVLTGAGDKAFIGGADIREMSALADAEDGRRLHAGGCPFAPGASRYGASFNAAGRRGGVGSGGSGRSQAHCSPVIRNFENQS